MKLNTYYDEFFNNKYLRDFRTIGKTIRTCHAPTKPSTKIEQTKKAKRHLLKYKQNKMNKYTKLYGGLAYYDSIIDYQMDNDDMKYFNHIFLDFDSHNDKFEQIKNKIKIAEDLTGKEYMHQMDNLQKQIRNLIFNEDLLKESWLESKKVNDYFMEQGLKTYPCFSGSKGVHNRIFFKPVQLKYYNRIIHNLHSNLKKKFDLKTLDDKVGGKDSNPRKSVERLPYTYNEKSGLILIPFDFEVDNLDDVLDKSMKLSRHNNINHIDEFHLDNYINNEFHYGLERLNSKISELAIMEDKAKEKLDNTKKVHGKYVGNTGLFKDLRTLVRFLNGDNNLVNTHDRYDSYHCIFHDDKHPSAYVGVKKYTCLSSNCRIKKPLNYFDFIREYFKLKSDDEVKEKMVELQKLYDQQSDVPMSDEKMDKVMSNISQEVNA